MSIENTLDFDLKRLFNKTRRKVKFPQIKDENKTESLKTLFDDARREVKFPRVKEENETDSLKRLFDDAREKVKFHRDKIGDESAKSSWSENLIRNGIGKKKEKSAEHLGNSTLNSNSNRDKEKDNLNLSGFGVKKIEDFVRKGIGKSTKLNQGEKQIYYKSKLPKKHYKKITEDRYLHTIFRKDRNKEQVENKYPFLKQKKKLLKLNKNTERIIRKINHLNDNDYNDEDTEKGFELMKPEKPKTLIKWKESSFDPTKVEDIRETTETTTKKIKLRRRKRKKFDSKENNTDTINVLHESHFQEKVRKPLKKEWNSIFKQSTIYPRNEYIETTVRTTEQTEFPKEKFQLIFITSPLRIEHPPSLDFSL